MKVCNRCIINSSVPSFVKYKDGCSFCIPFSKKLEKNKFLKKDPTELKFLIEKIKSQGKNKPYDCIVGLSGGVDSSWALVKAKELGLNPLAVHMDNGWNSELAQNNIQALLENLKLDLHTYVVDWEEYKNLMKAFFAADVIDIELLMDNAMLATNYFMANKLGLKMILTGSNLVTEGIRMPPGWIWPKFDKTNILSIAKSYGINKFKSFPAIGNLQKLYFERIKGIRWISFLDYLDYSREKALIELQSLGFKPYPYKHYESIFTRFYQAYILPKKFQVDKRLIHLSAQIVSNDISRDKALLKMEDSPYSFEQEQEDLEYFLSKFGWSKFELDEYLSRPPKPHNFYKSEGNYGDEFLEGIKKKFYRKKSKK